MTADFCLLSVALASAVFFSSHSSPLFVGFYQLQSSVSSLLFISPYTPSSFHVSWNLVKFFFSPLSSSAHPPSSISVFRSNSWFPPFSIGWSGCQAVWCIHACLPYAEKERERISCAASNMFHLMGLVHLSPVTTKIIHTIIQIKKIQLNN